MEALDQAEGLTDPQREMPPPPSEPAQKLPPPDARSHSLTVKSSLCLLAASQFLVRTSQASLGLETVRVEGQPSTPRHAGRPGVWRGNSVTPALGLA